MENQQLLAEKCGWKDNTTMIQATLVANKVSEELRKAILKHGSMKSLHEAYSVILEEMDEFWDLVKQKNPNLIDVMNELIQISAMAQRAIIDLELDPNMCK